MNPALPVADKTLDLDNDEIEQYTTLEYFDSITFIMMLCFRQIVLGKPLLSRLALISCILYKSYWAVQF